MKGYWILGEHMLEIGSDGKFIPGEEKVKSSHWC